MKRKPNPTEKSRMHRDIDPRILYCLVLPDDDPYKTSPFQGFSPGWIGMAWPMLRLIDFPGDVFEPALPPQSVRARRISGTGGWHWFPLSLAALTSLSIDPRTPFWVIFSGEPKVASAVSDWAKTQLVRPLHVAPQACDGAIAGEDLTTWRIGEHIDSTLRDLKCYDASLDCNPLQEVRSKWSDRLLVDAAIPKRAHNCTLPNHMVLEAAGVRFNEAIPLIGDSMEPYTHAIRETVESVRTIRQDLRNVPGFRLTPPQPALILTAPALYRHNYRSTDLVTQGKFSDADVINKLFRFFQRQKTFHWSLEREDGERLLSSPQAQSVLRIRQEELQVHTLAVGLRAASTLAATVRVPPAVNRTADAVRKLATYDRTAEAIHPRRFARLFLAVQKALEASIGNDLLQLISNTDSGIKLVTDAPMEWLPIGNLPMGLRFDCSRITATPGNLMVGELVLPRLMNLRANMFSDVLLLSAYGARDPFRHMIPSALDSVSPMWRNSLNIRSLEVSNETEFCDALNSYEGNILIFDGHGGHREDSGIATLAIGEHEVNLWSLRSTVRIPPVVVLSACDTHAADRSHATTANAFLAGGARAVLGTLLPIEVDSAAIFVARMLHRLADFFAPTIAMRGEAIQWSEFVTGMLRMQLVTDMLRPYLAEGILTQEIYEEIHFHGNVAINLREKDWFEFITRLTAERLAFPLQRVERDFQLRIPTSETIRYVHMGNPETILVDEESTMERVKEDVERLGSTQKTLLHSYVGE